MRSRIDGFTLVELMVTVVVLFMLGSIAIPMYADYIDNGRRQAVVSVVDGYRLFASNYRVENNTYVTGSYDPHGANTLEATTGYRKDGSEGEVSFTVDVGSCGDIINCYAVTATDGHVTGTWDSATDKWTWTD